MEKVLFVIFMSFLILSCSKKEKSYQERLNIIKKKTKIIELVSNDGKGRIAIAPEIQGKVLQSTHNGLNGATNGWLNLEAFQTNDLSNIGGEERLWFGPLGGQHSFYYQHIKPLNEDNWKVPKSLSIEPFQLQFSSDAEAVFTKRFSLTNFIGTELNFDLVRRIGLYDKKRIEKDLDIKISDDIKSIAYQTYHELRNIDTVQWKKELGLVSIWSAGMFQGTDKSVVIMPLKKKTNLDSIYQYMGDLTSERLQLKNNTLLFKVDGKYRSKIGIPPSLSPDIYGCYTLEKRRLTIVKFKKEQTDLYANSYVTIQKNPYKGEVIPIYNNGNMDYSISKEASFFELESTSSFKELKPQESLNHFHSVFHFFGSEKGLNEISKKLLGVSLNESILE